MNTENNVKKNIHNLDYRRRITIRLAVHSDAPDMAEVLMRSWETAYKDIIPLDFIREKNATRPATTAHSSPYHDSP